MSEIARITAFKDEVMLQQWVDSATLGRRVTFQLNEEGPEHPFKKYTVAKGKLPGTRFAMVLVEIGDDEKPVEQSQPADPLRAALESAGQQVLEIPEPAEKGPPAPVDAPAIVASASVAAPEPEASTVANAVTSPGVAAVAEAAAADAPIEAEPPSEQSVPPAAVDSQNQAVTIVASGPVDVDELWIHQVVWDPDLQKVVPRKGIVMDAIASTGSAAPMAGAAALADSVRRIRNMVEGREPVQDAPPAIAAMVASLSDAFGDVTVKVEGAKTKAEVEAEETQKGGQLARLAGILCNLEGFRGWLARQVSPEQNPAPLTVDQAAAAIRDVCGVTSRAQLDHDPVAAETFHECIRNPWLAFNESSGPS